jgi:exopolysaccharide production protein ExoY
MFNSFVSQPSDIRLFVGPARRVIAPMPETSSDQMTRFLDVSIALAGLLFFAPLMILIAAAIMASGGPVLFRQMRLGQGGELFACLKFRTMYVDAEQLLAEVLANDPVARAGWEREHKLRRDPRVSTVGRFLRKTSLDELPQLFNVIAGSMSIVGPRPIVAAEAKRYGRYIRTYCAVRPGITGLWQISGRNETSYRRRVACDVAYVRTRSALKDLLIIVKTIPAVCFARGAY